MKVKYSNGLVAEVIVEEDQVLVMLEDTDNVYEVSPNSRQMRMPVADKSDVIYALAQALIDSKTEVSDTRLQVAASVLNGMMACPLDVGPVREEENINTKPLKRVQYALKHADLLIAEVAKCGVVE
jgi:hypothetical protein